MARLKSLISKLRAHLAVPADDAGYVWEMLDGPNHRPYGLQ